MKRAFSFICFLLILLSVSAEDRIDSLFNLLDKYPDDTSKVSLLLQLSQEHAIKGDDAKTILFAEDAIGLAENLKSAKYIATTRTKAAQLYTNAGKSNKALSELNKLATYYEELNDSMKMAQTYSYLAAIYDLQGNHPIALENYYKALQINEKLIDKRNIVSNSGNIGKVYMYQKKYSESTKFFFKALSVSKEIEFLEGMANCYNNLGILHYYQENTDSALFYFFQSEIFKTNLNDSIGLSSLYNNLGEIYFLQEDYDKALEYNEKAKAIQYRVNDKEGLVYSFINIGSVYEKQGKYNDAINAHEQALVIARSLQANWLIMEAYFFIHQDYKGKGDFDQALGYFTKYHHLRDSLNTYESAHKIEQLKAKYDSGQKDMQIKQLEMENKEHVAVAEQKSMIQMLLTILAVFLVAIIILMIRQMTLRKRNNFLLEKMLKQKEVLLKEVHHRVKNNFQLISSLLNLQSSTVKDQKIQSALLKNKNRIDSMALVHRSLYENDDLVNVDFEHYVNQLVENVRSTFSTDDKNIDTIVIIKNVKLESEQAIPLGLIINELITNSFKYGFEGKSSGEIHIELDQIEEGRYKLIVKDNGVGIPQDLNIEEVDSLGLELIRLLTEQLDGLLDLDRSNGTTFTIVFPNN